MRIPGLPPTLLDDKSQRPLPLYYEALFAAVGEMLRQGLHSGLCDWTPLQNLSLPTKMERQLLLYHGVIPLLCEWDSLQVSKDKTQWLTEIALLNEARESQWQITLQDLFRRFAEHDIRALLIKGTGLAYTLYGKASLRPRSDTDLWVTREQSHAARNELHEAGFKNLIEDTEYGFSVTSQTQTIDVKYFAHRRPLFRNALSFEDACKRSIATNIPLARTVHPADALLLTAWNRVADLSWSHRAQPLIHIVDGVLLWKKLGDDHVASLIDWSDEQGLGDALRHLILLTATCRSQRVGTRLASSLWSSARGPSQFYLSGIENSAAFYLDVRSFATIREKGRYLLRLATPPNHELWYWWRLRGWKGRHPRLASVVAPFLYAMSALRILAQLGRGYFKTAGRTGLADNSL